MKCLEKDRNRRYETASSLARDIERYLHDEPVQACPPSAGYRFRKFARRNKTLIAAGGAISAALVIAWARTGSIFATTKRRARPYPACLRRYRFLQSRRTKGFAETTLASCRMSSRQGWAING